MDLRTPSGESRAGILPSFGSTITELRYSPY